MTERVVTLLCALGALVLFLTILVGGERDVPARSSVGLPTTETRHGNGYRVAVAWLRAEHIRTASLRERFDKLPQRAGAPAIGNVLIVTLPAASAFNRQELRSLSDWIRGGNTLLVLAALSDRPDWAASSLGGTTAGDLALLTGLEFKVTGRRDGSDGAHRLAEPGRLTLVPNGPHAYFGGVHNASALSDYAPQTSTVRVPYDGFVFCLAHEQESGEGALCTRPVGAGRLIVSAFGSLFTDRAIGLGDNAQLLANLLAANLGPGGVVLFDDQHQGLQAVYDPAKFFRDSRLYQTIAVLSTLWLAWVLGATRLQMPIARSPVPREAELVRATGRFLARTLTPAAAARRLLDRFLRDYSWETIERHSRVARADILQLRAWDADASASRRVQLTRVHNLIVKVQRQLGHRGLS